MKDKKYKAAKVLGFCVTTIGLWVVVLSPFPKFSVGASGPLAYLLAVDVNFMLALIPWMIVISGICLFFAKGIVQLYTLNFDKETKA